MARKIDLAAVPVQSGSSYPELFHSPCMPQSHEKLGNHAGPTEFGVSLTVFQPRAWFSQRRWHTHEDEFVRVVEGELAPVTESGEETLRAGDCAAFRGGDVDGRPLINRTGRPATVLEIGNASPPGVCTFSDIDRIARPGEEGYRRKDGRPCPERARAPARRRSAKNLCQRGCQRGRDPIEGASASNGSRRQRGQGIYSLAIPVAMSMFRSLNRLGQRPGGMPRLPWVAGFVSEDRRFLRKLRSLRKTKTSG